MTIDAEFAAPLTGPMHSMLDNALTPYLDGDLDASDNLIDALLEVIASAERTSELIRTLHGAIKTLPPTRELMPAMHQAIGAALELDTAAPSNTSYGSASSRSAAARTSSGTSREGSIASRIQGLFAKSPSTPMRVGDLVKALSNLGHEHSGGAVGAALTGMVARGEAVQVGEKPKLYLAADDPEAPQSADAAPEQEAPAPEQDAPAAKRNPAKPAK